MAVALKSEWVLQTKNVKIESKGGEDPSKLVTEDKADGKEYDANRRTEFNIWEVNGKQPPGRRGFPRRRREVAGQDVHQARRA